MPRYFFDVDDGERSVRDEVGLALGSIREIEDETRELLHVLSLAEIGKGKPRLFTATVRDGRGVTIYKGSVEFRVDRLS